MFFACSPSIPSTALTNFPPRTFELDGGLNQSCPGCQLLAEGGLLIVDEAFEGESYGCQGRKLR